MSKTADPQEILVGTGELELIKDDGKFLLVQGEVAVDLTSVLQSVNHSMGKVVLGIRESDHREVLATTDNSWFREGFRTQTGKKITSHQEDGFSKVSGADDTGKE